MYCHFNFERIQIYRILQEKQKLTIYANNNAAYIESQKIISLHGNFLKFTATKINRGVNIQNEISKTAETIKESINSIRNTLSVQDFKDVQQILCTEKLDVEKYIDSIVTCAILQNNSFPIDENYYLAKNAFNEIHELLKRKVTETEEKLV